MSVIQKIQDKYAKLMAIIIAVALMIFVVMLAFENGGSLFRGGNATTVGKVNGRRIEYGDFMRKVDQQEKQMESQGYQGGAALQQQAIEQVWNEEINQTILNSELDKVGISVGAREMGDILYGPDAPQDLKRAFTDTATGQYNWQQAKAYIDAVIRRKKGTPQQLEERNQFINFINAHETARLNEKYTSLLTNSVNFPKWFIEKEIADNSQLAKISLVRNFYTSVMDSTITVSDKEIRDYLDEHKKEFKAQMQESRGISYVAISTLPSAADSAAARSRIESFKAEFDTATADIPGFLAKAGSTITAAPIYAGKSQMQQPNKDTLQKMPINTVFGPYIDGPNFALAKMLDIKQLPDSVKCRHILLGTMDRSGQPLLDDSVAHKTADSIALAIRNGANFDTLETKFSSDKVSHEQKGVMTVSSTDIQSRFAKAFGDFILFDGKPGDKKVVKTEFGWHYIEILSFIKPEPHYKIAILSRPIESSPETQNNASNLAAQFAGNSRDQKSFDANAAKLIAEQKSARKGSAPEITPITYEIPGLGASRTLVKNIYKADLGDVLEPEQAGDNWVVALVTEINEEGKMSPAKARMQIEPRLRDEKIADKLIKQAGNVTTLEAAAAAWGGKQIETIDSLRMGQQTTNAARALASEPKVLGAAFNPANRGKVVPQVIKGRNGVYVIRVDNVSATAVADANVAEQRRSRYQTEKNMAQYRPNSNPIQVLREAATIKDRRIEFF